MVVVLVSMKSFPPKHCCALLTVNPEVLDSHSPVWRCCRYSPCRYSGAGVHWIIPEPRNYAQCPWYYNCCHRPYPSNNSAPPRFHRAAVGKGERIVVKSNGCPYQRWQQRSDSGWGVPGGSCCLHIRYRMFQQPDIVHARLRITMRRVCRCIGIPISHVPVIGNCSGGDGACIVKRELVVPQTLFGRAGNIEAGYRHFVYRDHLCGCIGLTSYKTKHRRVIGSALRYRIGGLRGARYGDVVAIHWMLSAAFTFSTAACGSPAQKVASPISCKLLSSTAALTTTVSVVTHPPPSCDVATT